MLGFDSMFDFDGNGQLDGFEQGMQFRFFHEMMKGTKSGKNDSDRDILAEAGLDYEELEAMHPRERRKVLRKAGLKPEKFGF